MGVPLWVVLFALAFLFWLIGQIKRAQTIATITNAKEKEFVGSRGDCIVKEVIREEKEFVGNRGNCIVKEK